MTRTQTRTRPSTSRRTVLIRRRLIHPRPLTPLYPLMGGTMQPEDDVRLGTPPEARHPTEEKPPRLALGLMIGLIAASAVVVGIILWLYGNVPGSG